MTLCFSVLLVSEVHAQIRSAGAHRNYSVELEPHGLVKWDVEPGNEAGLGFGFRAMIPIMQNGPVTTINNSLAVGFGLDWAYANETVYHGRPRYDDCDAHNITVPLVVQWNFYFTEVVSLFVETGLGVMYETWENDTHHDDNVEPDFIFLVGPRFTVADTVAIVLRIGWPTFSLGVSFLL